MMKGVNKIPIQSNTWIKNKIDRDLLEILLIYNRKIWIVYQGPSRRALKVVAMSIKIYKKMIVMKD